MADTIKTEQTLKMTATFADGDERTISIDNPIDNITLSQISELATKAANVLIGDKSGAAFVSFKEPKYVETTTEYLEIS